MLRALLLLVLFVSCSVSGRTGVGSSGLLLISGGSPTIHDAVALVSGRMMTRMAQQQLYNDALLSEFAKERARPAELYP